MAEWLMVGTLDDLWEGEMMAVNFGAVDVLLCNVDGELFAYEDRCPHLANPLSQGDLRDGVLTCAAHEWEFDARTGRGRRGVRAGAPRTRRDPWYETGTGGQPGTGRPIGRFRCDRLSGRWST